MRAEALAKMLNEHVARHELVAAKAPYKVFDYFDLAHGDKQLWMVSSLAIPQRPVALCGPDKEMADAICVLLNQEASENA